MSRFFKILIIGFILYLLYNNLKKSKVEKFDEKNINFDNPVKVKLSDTNNTYEFITIEEFKKPYQDKIINYLKNNYPNFTNLNMSVENFVLKPVFIIKSTDVNKYSKNNNISNYYVRNIGGYYYLVPFINNNIYDGHYLYIEPNNDLLVHSTNYLKSRIIKFDNNDYISYGYLKDYKIDDMDLYTIDVNELKKNIKIDLKQ